MLKINNKIVTDSTKEYQNGMLFLLTSQNRKYFTNQNFITPQEILKGCKTKFIGITGTNGKTTTAFLIGYILKELGYNVAVQGTEGFYLNGEKMEEKTLTTPPIIKTIERVFKYKPDFFVMEVSSHAIIQNRIDGINFSLKIFTNLSQDHLDFHKTMLEYKKAKELFFQDNSLKIINKKFLEGEYALKIEMQNSYFYPLSRVFKTALKGEFNQENFQSAVLGVSKLLSIELEKVVEIASNFKGVAGRMEEVVSGIIIDFAHTPDGMEKVLSSINNKKIVIFGAGGERDVSKREKMGGVADKYADYIILTNDNPRCEDEKKIIDDIKNGITSTPYEVVLNRADAIKKGIELKNSFKDSVTLFILGKGDETFIEKCNKKIPFSDKEVVLSFI